MRQGRGKNPKQHKFLLRATGWLAAPILGLGDVGEGTDLGQEANVQVELELTEKLLEVIQ